VSTGAGADGTETAASTKRASPGEVLTRVERELRELWTSGAPSSPSPSPSPATRVPPRSRACTMNLVVVAGSTELAERYTSVVDEVTRSVPARAIVVALDPDARVDSLDGDVTAVCSTNDATTLCSERVSLVARGTVCGRVGSAIEALSVPEMPTVLVWLGRVHVSDAVFQSVAKDAQRVVLDTEYTSLASLLHLARWTREAPGRPHVADLAWTRLAVWQEMCARFFDEPSLRDHANNVTRLEVRQASEPGARLGSEGALLLGWLATRLGWKAERVGGSLRFRRPDGALIAVDLGAVARPPEVAPAALAAVSIEAEHAGVALKGTLVRELASGLREDAPDADVLVWHLDAPVPSATEQRVRLRANRGARLLERTLHRAPFDPALAEAALFAEEALEDGVVCR
jgi:glucose-6-phosphate dehydrogenase assembly protein OpcA